MDYVIALIFAVVVMALVWCGSDRGAGPGEFFTDILTGALYFIAFSISSLAAAALFKALLLVYACGSAWVGAMIEGSPVASANLAAGLAYAKTAGADFTLGTGANILWGWTFCFVALSFRILSGRWPHQRSQGRI